MASEQIAVPGVDGHRNGVHHPPAKTPNFHNLSKATITSNINGKQILDIRRDPGEISLENEIFQGLQAPAGQEKTLPTLLLYDERGLKLFEDITYLDEYYPTNEEIQVLEKYADDIAQRLAPNSIVLELGSGNLRKVNILLRAIDRLGKNAEYFALDLSLKELERTLADIPNYRHVRCFGLHGTYDDGLVWLKSADVEPRHKAILWLGSSMGNMPRGEDASFLQGFAQALNNDDFVLVGADECQDADRIFHAYNDRHGVTHRFTLNGLANANRIVGQDIFNLDEWRAIGRFDKIGSRHEAFVSPTKDTYVRDTLVKKDELVRIEQSHKYNPDALAKLWDVAGVTEIAKFSNERRDYSLNLMAKKNYAFSQDPKVYAAGEAPTWDEWTELWKLWDAVTREMIPDEELLSKPIKLRNVCLFYLGHIPTFFDMKLTDTTDGIPTEPKHYPQIFERGIDPDVDNPEQCHAHSEIPDEWPPLEEILTFQKRVRERVKGLYDSGAASDMSVARCLWLGYEHECMHLETLLYMLVQSNQMLPPPGPGNPDFKAIAEKAKLEAVPNEWFDIPAQDIVIGLDDPETNSGNKRHFGWDVEKPPRKVHVPTFSAKARPITNGEYALYLIQTGTEKIPASWQEIDHHANGHTNGNGVANGHTNGTTNGNTNGTTNGHTNGTTNGNSHTKIVPDSFLYGKAVRTVYGPVPLAYALDWPVSASYDELAACAEFMGGRIPTFEEARSIYTYVNGNREAQESISVNIPAVNSHLVNDGVEETPPHTASHRSAAGVGSSGAGTLPNVFENLEGCNVGFQHWHPMPVTQNGKKLAGQAGMGGLWEWTATPLAEHEGYEPMKLYPAFSQDFFDGKHNIILGGSWATTPRLAGRKTFVNWYQRNYPYVWATVRMVRDL